MFGMLLLVSTLKGYRVFGSKGLDQPRDVLLDFDPDYSRLDNGIVFL